MGDTIIDKMAQSLEGQIEKSRQALENYRSNKITANKIRAEREAFFSKELTRRVKEEIKAFEAIAKSVPGKILDSLCPRCSGPTGIFINLEKDGEHRSYSLGTAAFKLRETREGVATCPRCKASYRVF